MKFLFTNNARATLQNPITALDTNLTLTAALGALFPNPGVGEAFRFSLIDNLGNIEIAECTTRVGDGFTVITRGKEGTVARAFAAGSRVALRVTKGILESLRDGGNLGTMALQNADNVTITGGTIGGAPIGANTGMPLPRSYLAGLTLSNDAGDATNDIGIAVGTCSDKDNTANIILAAALIKRLDAAWAVGTNQGMRATGGAIANGVYHIFAILRPDTAVVDIAADTSVTGANVTANTNAAYTKMRRIGAILREGGSIVAFTQQGDEFLRTTAVLDVDANNPGTANVNRTLSVPTGLKVRAIMNPQCSFGATGSMGIFATLDETDSAPSLTVAPLATNGTGSNDTHQVGRMEMRTNTSGQIRSRVDGSDGSANVRIATLGWIDRRGRDD